MRSGNGRAASIPAMGEVSPAGPVLIHRAIVLRRPRPDAVVAWLEDPFHHFGLTLETRNGAVRAVRVRVIRLPWTTCAEAADPLRAIEGRPLIRRPSELSRELPMGDHCTHLFELAALAMTHAAQDRHDLRYDAVVAGEPIAAGPSRRLEATLAANGRRRLRWTLAGDVISAPLPAAGRSLTRGFHAWLDQMSDEEAEHAWVLRRAAWLSLGSLRHHSVRYASEAGMGPVCYTFTAPQSGRAEAVPGSHRPYDPDGPPRLQYAGEEP